MIVQWTAANRPSMRRNDAAESTRTAQRIDTAPAKTPKNPAAAIGIDTPHATKKSFSDAEMLRQMGI